MADPAEKVRKWNLSQHNVVEMSPTNSPTPSKKVEEVSPKPTTSSWLSWHEPNTSKEEKRLILKLDWFILSYSCLCFFIKQLDQQNINNAYNSGMKEDLGFYGDELSWMNSLFSAGQLIGSPFANIIITVVGPRIWLPSCLTIWSLFVLFLYKCNTAAQFYALRFCIGLFESAAWPGVEYTLGSWYRKSELARRSALFVSSGVLGQMFSGYVQAGLHANMDGVGGLAAWRWLFIFDFVLGVPVIIYGFLCHPDVPETTKACYLNAWEKQRAKERLEEEGREPNTKLNLTLIKRVLCSWQFYAFVLGYAFWSLTCGTYIIQYFTIYLKSTQQYSIEQVNSIPTANSATNLLTMLSTGFISDKIGTRAPACLAVGMILIFTYSVLTAWTVPHALRIFVFILNGVYGCFTPLLAGWLNESCGGDKQKRALILGLMTSVGPAVTIPFQQLQFPSSQAPEFKETHGYASALAFVVLLMLWTGIAIPLMQRRWQKKAAPVSRPEFIGEEES